MKLKLVEYYLTVLKQQAASDKGMHFLPCCFNIMLEKVIRNTELNPGGSIFTTTRQYMVYADDMAVIGRSLQAVSEVIQQMEEPALTIWLDINAEKMKYMNTSRCRQQDTHTPGQWILMEKYIRK
jgi:hypothetical protein